MKSRIWLWTLLVLVAADLLLAATGTRILIRQQRGQAWLIDESLLVSTKTNISQYKEKRKVPILACTYWTGIGTKTAYSPFAPASQSCTWTTR